MTQIYLYTTLGCHLCEQALALAAPLAAAHHCHIEPVEIADSDDLIACYGVRIPVLRLAGGESELGWPFDQDALLQWLLPQLPQGGC